MGLGGLWHGASWNFVIWGLFHGILLALHRAWRTWRGNPSPTGRIANAASVALTFLLVTIGWVTFRAPDFATTLHVLADMFAGAVRIRTTIPNEFTALLAVSALWLALDRDRRLQAWLAEPDGRWASVRIAGAIALSLLAIELFARTDIAVPFIYFQF